ncbi:GSU3473 family protein [Geomesophilobacter sediminis]|uniref:Uncharacterized protein n=1 Tax=Geomesophilobacter sediminis TaxID=2798584 RepID=A0A8J7IRT6_9BACT|nr:hypothetical protein [Geomesophilobacter sediminis]MBJ6725779.1 hypothetical protein [Geomesophilobacter sediminis]
MFVRIVRTDGKIELAPAREIDLLIQEGEITAFCRAEGWVVIGKDAIRTTQVPYSGVGRRWSDIVKRCRSFARASVPDDTQGGGS